MNTLALVVTLLLCVWHTATSMPPQPPTINAPFYSACDIYLSDTDNIMTINTGTTSDATVTFNYGAEGNETVLTVKNTTYLAIPEYGQVKCYTSPAFPFDTSISYEGYNFLDTVFYRGNLVNHFQMHWPDNRRIGVYVDSRGLPVRQQPTFQFATMVWDFFTFENSNPPSSWMQVPPQCLSNPIPNPELVEDHILRSPHLAHLHTAAEFMKWSRQHKKVYSSLEERQARYQNYKRHDAMIKRHNADPKKTYTQGHNAKSDFHPHEFQRNFGRRVPLNAHMYDKPYVMPKEHTAMSLQALPDSLDWIAKGAVGRPRNQQMCGSCWAFGSLEALQGAYFLKYGNFTVLSPQNMVDCAWRNNCSGCDGCTARMAWLTIQQQGGIATDLAYPYQGVDGFNCYYTKGMAAPGVQVKEWQVITPGNVTQAYSALQQGPLAIAIDAQLPSFNFYTGGVYNDANCKSDYNDLDHEVLLTGYGQENNMPYWTLMNSWGILYGNSGTVKVAVNNNICGVVTDAVLPIVV